MTPEILNTDYYVVDGPCGTEYIPADLVAGDVPTDCCGPIPEGLRDYCENRECHRLEYVESGWLARLSMPGYLDCTEWLSADSEADAIQQLLELYGTDDGEPEQWERDAQEWLDENREG